LCFFDLHEINTILGVNHNTIHAYGITKRGAHHVKHNIPCQDAHKIIAHTDDIVIAAVADGLGSEEHSDIASKIAVKVSTAYCTKHITSFSTCEKICNVIEHSFRLAQNKIEKKARSNEHGIEQYDTTLTLVVVIGDTLYYGHSGDSGIIVLTDAGLYEQVTEQQRDEEGRVFPLFREDRRIFDRYEKEVACVLLATDGLFETLIPMCLRDDPVKIYVKLARFFMDNRYLRIDELGENAVRSRIEEYVDAIPVEQVDDDKTVVVLVNTDVSYVLDPAEYVDLPDVSEREEERKKKVQKELYPHLFRDKKDHATKQQQSDASSDEEMGQDDGTNISPLTNIAQQGDAEAQFPSGNCYCNGERVVKDENKP
jgi:serine/threonine protein phosphatase PrpC